jgi:hypothetical protein
VTGAKGFAFTAGGFYYSLINCKRTSQPNLYGKNGGHMHAMHRYALGAALVIVLSIAGCVTFPGGGGVVRTETVVAPTAMIAAETPVPVTITPSITPTPSATAIPSETPVPTITQTPTKTPIPGWHLITGDEVSLWLPESWRGGNLEEDLDQLLADAPNEAPEVRQYAEVLEENRSNILLWAYDTQSTGSFHLTNVNIGQELVDDAVTVDLYMDALDRNLLEGFTITGRQLMDIHDYQGGRIFIDVNINGLIIKEVMYIFKVADKMWLVTFAAASDVFDIQLPVLEMSMQTVEIGEEAERE